MISPIELLNTLKSLNIRLALNDNAELVVRGDKSKLNGELIATIKQCKPQLVTILQQNREQQPLHIDAVADNCAVGLSYAQQRLWLLDQIDDGSVHYNMPFALEIEGALDKQALAQAFKIIVDRHQVLRSCIVLGADEQPQQKVLDAATFDVESQDLSHLDADARAQAIAKYTQAQAVKPFDLTADLMIKVVLLKHCDTLHTLLVTMHHIASDGQSMTILINEFTQLYRALVNGQPNPLPALPIQYRDYAHWQRQWLSGDNLTEQLDYWQQQLKDLPLVHSLALDYPRPPIQSFEGQQHTSVVDSQTCDALAALCQSHQASFFMGLYTVFTALLSRLSNESDIVVGTPVANREQAQVKDLIGFFVNTLVLRADVHEGASFNQLLGQSKQRLQQAFSHQQMPFEQIVERLQPQRSLSHTPLFQVMLVLEQQGGEAQSFDGLQLKAADNQPVVAKYDLSLNVVRTEQGMTLNWVYNKDLFKPETIAFAAQSFNRLLTQLLRSPDSSVHQLPMLGESESQEILALSHFEQMCAMTERLPSDSVIDLFQRQVSAQPDNTAVVFEQQQLSYQQLNQRANRLAHYLIQQRNVKPDTLVGICLERSIDTVVAILAVLKAGGAYVPLDPDYPTARLQYIIDDASLETIVTCSGLIDKAPFDTQQAVFIDQLSGTLQHADDADPVVTGLENHHLAYVIYTSGSTGQPKGVEVSHYNVRQLLASALQSFDIGDSDVWTLFHSFAFDFSVWELWGALALGGRLVVVPYWVSRSPQDFYALVSREKVTVLNQTPSAFGAFSSHVLAASGRSELALRYVIFGGEALNLASLKPWVAQYGVDKTALVNMYGITETTVHVTFKMLNEAEISQAKGNSPIGTPLASLAVLVLNQEQALLPKGVAGEMYVAGAGVARGYLNQPSLSAERFVELADFPGQRFYRTGDIGRYQANGELEYLGRIDHQVKIRGFRIELGEIQNALTDVIGVQDAHVMTVKGRDGQTQIVAYVVASEQFESHDLRRQLAERLPAFMIPAAFVLLDKLPLTANGKVDSKALPQADVASAQRRYVAPTTDTETLLCNIWQRVLGLEQVGLEDNFFALGGHSLLVLQVISALQAEGLSMSARDLFASDTLGELASVIDSNGQSAYSAPANLIAVGSTEILPAHLPLVELTAEQIATLAEQIAGGCENIQDIYPLGPLQQGILFHHIASDAGDPYVMPSLFTIEGDDNIDRFIAAMNFVIQRHDILRSGIFWQGLETPVQVVCREAELPVRWVELTQECDAVAHMQQLCDPALQRMALHQAPLVKAQISTQPNSEFHVVMLQLHHIIADHITQEIISREIELYFSNATASLSAPVPYREFIAHTLHQAKTHDAKAFFSAMLKDADEPTAPFGLQDVQGDGSKVSQQLLMLAPELSADIRLAARRLNITPASIFHSAWALVLGGCCGRDDVVFGTVMSGRLQGMRGAEQMPGVFINTLPIRVAFAAVSATDLVQQVQQLLQSMIPYEQTPLSVAQRCSAMSGEGALFSALINYRHNLPPQEQAQQSSFNYLGAQERTNYPLLLSVNDQGQDFELDLQVDDSLEASRINGYVVSVLQQLAAALLQSIDGKPVLARELTLLDDQQQQQLNRWNDTALPFAGVALIHRLIETQAAATPDAVAVKLHEQALSYDQLNRRANRLAGYLRECCGVGPDVLVGICLERSLDMVVAMLAIWKAGGAYVPLDPDYPPSRIAYMAEDAQLSTILTQQRFNPLLRAGTLLNLDCQTLNGQLENYDDDNISVEALSSQHLAYVIYTSGSTGQPKGVMIEHLALYNRINWMQRQYGCCAADNILQKTPFSFDVSVWEFVWPLSTGATLVLAKPGGHREPQYLSDVIAELQISKLHFVPSMLASMLKLGDLSRATALAEVFCSGEALPTDLVAQFKQQCPQVALHNLYGPTEAAIDVSFYECVRADERYPSAPIGQPIDNICFKVVDKYDKPTAIGVAGQLLIGGVGLARGYWHRQSLSDSAFFRDEHGQRWYRSGDLVRYLADGSLLYLGRIDHQVKVRGFRIEPGEIEAVLLADCQVGEAVVIADSDAQRLIAYVTLNGQRVDSMDEQHTVQTQQQLLQMLADKLPQHMVPGVIVLLDEMPVTANGKLDRRALPSVEGRQAQAQYVAPTTQMECLLVDIWQQVLSLPKVSIQDNFFAIGGHSLQVMQVIALLQQHAIDMSVAQLFSSRSLAELAASLEQQSHTGNVEAANRSGFQAPPNLIPVDCQQLQPEMLPLIDLDAAQLQRIVEQVPGGAGNIEDIYPLGPLQQGILFHHMISPKYDPYVLTSLFRVKGKPVLDEFIAALQFVLDRHDVLRTAIMWEGLEQAVQVVQRQAQLPVSWLDVPQQQDCHTYMKAICDAKAQQMDLTRAPMLELKIAKQPDSEQYFVLILLHHIIADHVALETIQQEIIAYHRGQQQQLNPPVPYREFIAHVRHQAQHNNAFEFFSQMLGDMVTTTAPFGLSDIQGDGSEIRECRHRIDDDLAQQVRELASAKQMSPAVFFHAAWAMVLGACSGREDVVFGTVLSGRLQGTKGATNMLGVFINTLPFRVKLDGVDAEGLLAQVAQSLYQLLPFEQTSLVVAQQAANLPDEAPLFCALLNYRHATSDATTEPEHDPDAIFDYLGGQERSNYPLGMLVDDFDTGFLLNVQMHRSIDGHRIGHYMSVALRLLCRHSVARSQEPLVSLPLMASDEREVLLKQWNRPAVDYPTDLCLGQMFERHAARLGEATALVCEDQRLSFDQLNRRANRLARYLSQHCQVVPDTLVGICIERSLDMVIGVLAVLKAGGAYVPLDPEYPQARLTYMIEDARLKTVLTTQSLLGLSPLENVDTLCLDAPEFVEQLAQYSDENPAPCAELTADNLAYVIYTSGSTGQPKGVMIEHHSVVNLAQNLEKMSLQASGKMWGWTSSLSFDASVKGLTQLLSGYPLRIISEDSKKDPALLAPQLSDLAVIDCTPMVVDMWFEAGLAPQLPNLIIGGEAIHERQWQALIEWQAEHQRTAVNVYGPTECTVDAFATVIGEGDDPRGIGPNIGKPLDNVNAYVLDERQNLSLLGVQGELYLGGAGLARGYLHRPDLTAQRFIDNPFYDERVSTSAKRLYRTGDNVHWLDSGHMAFIGRCDNQVKVRGYRIELGEIEQLINAEPQVHDALVMVKPGTADDVRIIAYVVAEQSLRAEDEPAFITELEQSLAHKLPDFMLPSGWVMLEHFPLNANGKVDRQALPEPDQADHQTQYVAPQSELEAQLCEIWQQLLGVERVGVTDNFFNLGGHSLLLIKLLAMLKAKFKMTLNVKLIFELSDVRSLAAHIAVIDGAATGAANERADAKPPAGDSDEIETETFEI